MEKQHFLGDCVAVGQLLRFLGVPVPEEGEVWELLGVGLYFALVLQRHHFGQEVLAELQTKVS